MGEEASRAERALFTPTIWIGPSVLAVILLAEFAWMLVRGGPSAPATAGAGAAEIGTSLFSRYLIGVELASMLLLAGLVGAYHLGWRRVPKTEVADAARS